MKPVKMPKPKPKAKPPMGPPAGRGPMNRGPKTNVAKKKGKGPLGPLEDILG